MPKEKKSFSLTTIKQKLFYLFRLNNHPVIKVYNGYGNAEKIIVLGHVFLLSPFPRQSYSQNWIRNLFSLLRFYLVIPFSNAKISIEWKGYIFHTVAEKDGFFRFEIFPAIAPDEGWQSVLVRLEETGDYGRQITGSGKILIPPPSSHAFISDIDDTFLVSHSSHFRKRLYVLFTKNARSRKPFEGVVNHYQLLSTRERGNIHTNPFFYVSGSEWNLFDLIVEFSQTNSLPKGVFLLSHLRRIKDFWKSDENNITTKFRRISRIIETYPHLQFILLGDDSQQDPDIYSSIVSQFPKKIFAVYIRRVHQAKYENVQKIINNIESRGVLCCYFKHSAEAVIHSKMIGLIN